MKTFPPDLYQRFIDQYGAPAVEARSLIANASVGLVMLPADRFQYSPDVRYTFAMAAMSEQGTSRKLLFIRIDSRGLMRDPPNENADFCIPLASPDHTPAQQRELMIPFPGAWSDSRKEALVAFPEDWASWYAELSRGVAFSSPGAHSACLFEFSDPDRATLRDFCAARR